MIITLGFTESDRDYSSFSDGYRTGARQTSVTIVLEGSGAHLSAEQWAEAAFAASNMPGPATDPYAAAIQHALAEQACFPMRSLSVGDTVTVHGQMLACEHAGWRRVHAPPATGEHQ